MLQLEFVAKRMGAFPRPANPPRWGEMMIQLNRAGINTLSCALKTSLPGLAFMLLTAGYNVVFPVRARGDDFSRIAGSFLSDLMRRSDARSHVSLTTAELEALPEVLPRVRSAFLIVKTDEGNLAKLLVSSGLRKPKPGAKASALVPVLVLERLETLESSKYLSFKARGKEIVLFGEFPYDLDSGQVVPDGMGGDIVFRSAGENRARVSAVGDTRIYTFGRSVQPPPVARGRPSSGAHGRGG